MLKIISTIIGSLFLVTSANAALWRTSDGELVVNSYGECWVDSAGADARCGTARSVTPPAEDDDGPTSEKIESLANFDFDSDVLDAEAVRNVEALIARLSVLRNVRVDVSGHTDAVGTEEYNRHLGYRRAVAVANLLIDAGINVSSIVSHGWDLVFVETGDPERMNRRVDVEVSWEK